MSYKAEPTGRAGLEYAENDRKVFIDSEMLVGHEFDMVVYLESIVGWDVPRGEPVSAMDKARIRSNIAEAFKSQRIDWQ